MPGGRAPPAPGLRREAQLLERLGGGAEAGLFRTQRGASLRGRVRLRAPCARVRRAAGWTRTARASRRAGQPGSSPGGSSVAAAAAPRLLTFPGLSAPRRAAPRPATPTSRARRTAAPSLRPASPSACLKRGAERQAQRHRSPCPAAPQTESSPENPRGAPPGSATGSCPFSTAAAGVRAQPSGTAAGAGAQRSAPSSGVPVPLSGGPAISSGRRGEGASRAGRRAGAPAAGGSRQPGKERGRGPELALRPYSCSPAAQGGRQRASISPAPPPRESALRRRPLHNGAPISPPPFLLLGAGLSAWLREQLTLPSKAFVSLFYIFSAEMGTGARSPHPLFPPPRGALR